MRRSYVIGSFFGILLTIALWFGLNALGVIGPKPIRDAEDGENVVLAEDPNIPIYVPDEGYIPRFPGHEDLLAHRANLAPFISGDVWDRTLDAAVKAKMVQTSPGCSVADPAQAISITSTQAASVLAGKTNVLFLDARIPRCFQVAGKLTLLKDDFLSRSRLFDLAGQIMVDRILEIDVASVPEALLLGMKISKEDLPYLMNTEIAANRKYSSVTILHVRPTSYMPLLEPDEIPPYLPGAEVLKPSALTKYFAENFSDRKPVFVDARDRRHIANGASYPGAVVASFTAADSVQNRYQPDLLAAMEKGAKFDLRALPKETETPLIVFGDDAGDAAPLWVIRQLRIKNYRTIFYVQGGLKALNEVKPAIRF